MNEDWNLVESTKDEKGTLVKVYQFRDCDFFFSEMIIKEDGEEYLQTDIFIGGYELNAPVFKIS